MPWQTAERIGPAYPTGSIAGGNPRYFGRSGPGRSRDTPDTTPSVGGVKGTIPLRNVCVGALAAPEGYHRHVVVAVDLMHIDAGEFQRRNELGFGSAPRHSTGSGCAGTVTHPPAPPPHGQASY